MSRDKKNTTALSEGTQYLVTYYMYILLC